MPISDRVRHAVFGVWAQSHATCVAWPDERRAAASPAQDELLTCLGYAESVDELLEDYFAPGDPPGSLLRQHLPADFSDEEVLTLEEACLWRRVATITGEPVDDV